ncbi:MAG: hypothetical protein HND47_10990 [Chloroflexi bacterium]|nr:hypothetical protein [Chloroflexota bacterium]
MGAERRLAVDWHLRQSGRGLPHAHSANPRVLILGSEQKGLSAHQTDACDVVISLPMRGRVSSLNLSVAAGVLLYQLVR